MLTNFAIYLNINVQIYTYRLTLFATANAEASRIGSCARSNRRSQPLASSDEWLNYESRDGGNIAWPGEEERKTVVREQTCHDQTLLCAVLVDGSLFKEVVFVS